MRELLIVILFFILLVVLQNCERTCFVLLLSSLWVPHLVGMGFDFIVLAPPSCHLAVASSLSLDVEYLFQ